MTETLQALFGFSLIVGLFVWYFRERRAKNRPAPAAALEPVARPEPETAEPSSNEVSLGSPNWGAPLIYVILLTAIRATQRSWWSLLWLGIYFGIWALAVYSTFHPKELAAEQARRPGTTPAFHYVRYGVPYVLFPFVGWLVAVRLGWGLGVFIPALPWIFLIVGAPFIAVRSRA